jgi:DNA-binding MarR family transcriptional regulator
MSSPTAGARVESALGTLLLRTTRARLYDRLTESVAGVDPTTYPVLSGLARIGPATASQLGAAIGLDRTATTRYASRLETEGLLRRRPDARDGRATRLELTPAGQAAIATMRHTLVAALDQILQGWAPADAARFAADLERFAAALTCHDQSDFTGTQCQQSHFPDL